MSIQNKQLDQESIDRISHAVLIYAKDGKIKVLHIDQAHKLKASLIADGWRHTATMDAAMFIENLLNVELPNGKAISELKNLTITENERIELLELAAPIELFPLNGKAVEVISLKVGPPKVTMTIPGTSKDSFIFDALIDRVLDYKINGQIQMPFTGTLLSFFTNGPSHEEKIQEEKNPGYEAVMNYLLTFIINE